MREPFVLLVDDETPFLEITEKRLAARNVETLTATTGEECLEKLAAHETLDVVVLDMKMPGMDGIDVLKNIKKDYPLIEVIMLTGHGTMETAIKAMKKGAFDFLVKPFNIDELLFNIETATQKKREHEEKIKIALKQEILSKYGPFYYT
jgi:DNA-binding NtrC family response regulator